jgi:transposase-like protein
MRTMAAPRRSGFIDDVLRCQYERTTLASGAVVYAFTRVPTHYVCPQCFEHAQLHVLQREGAGSWVCPGCQTAFPVQTATGRISPV